MILNKRWIDLLMKKSFCLPVHGLVAVVLLVIATMVPAAEDGQSISDAVQSHTLDNGMELLMVQRDGAPMISAGWVARVGSANERPGITGMAHLFEHMMFKGSDRIGVQDAELDRELRAALDQVRADMFERERAHRMQVRLGEAESLAAAAAADPEMATLQNRFDELLERQRGNLVKDEFDKIYTDAGATGLNAFTTEDMTVYFIRVPSNKLELWFWMESERLRQPVFREFYSERDVVYEERRMRTDSTPTGAQNEVFDALFWRGHPYGWPVVGWPSDISAITRQQAEAFFDTYYAPNNITVVLVGDFSQPGALQLAERYFGPIPRGPAAPDVITQAMPLLGQVDYEAEVDAPPSAHLRYRTVAFNGADDPALNVLASVLSGKTGRLYKRLVLEEQLATDVSAVANGQKYGGSFSLEAQGVADTTPERLATVLSEELEKIRDQGITEYELEKAKNTINADFYRRLEDNFFLGLQLLYYEGLRDWRALDDWLDGQRAVTLDDVQRVASDYLTADRQTRRLYRRAMETAADDPALAAFSTEQRGVIDQLTRQLAGLDDEQRGDMLAELENRMGEMPEAVQEAVRFVIDRQEAE